MTISQHDQTIIQSLLDQLSEKDPAQLVHANRMADLMQKCVEPFELSKSDGEILATAALLHDVGVLHISDDILKKEGRLNLDEYEQVQAHTTLATELIQELSIAEKLAPIILHHHENMNGFGYPDGLEGNAIPFGSRLLHILEAFDAMVFPRPGKNISSPEKAVAELTEYAGRIYDPEILAKIAPILLAYPSGQGV